MKLNACVAGFLIFALSSGLRTHGEVGAAQESFERIKAEAEKGNAQSQSDLGTRYYIGVGVNQDYAEAVKWYRKAAVQGVATAQNNLGSCYHDGRGVTKDDREAVRWYREAAEHGVIKAQRNLGICYDRGIGVSQDYTEAVNWYRKAALQGDATAQFNLSIKYANGQGVTQDSVEAVKWCRKAAEQGDTAAQIGLGSCYDSGLRVTQDHAEAAKWYRKAAAQGYTDAQINLGICYYDGKGVAQNYLQAYIWFRIAAAKGDKGGAYLQDICAKLLSRDEISEGQRTAAAFIPNAETSGQSSDNSTSLKTPTATGSGFFITDNGYVISNYHVVKDASKVRLVMNTGLVDATVVKVDAANDLALLKADGSFAPLPITSSRSVKLGGTVATVGFPNTGMQGFAPKFAKGEIASLSGASDDARYFQISVPVQPGNSGGALVDVHGNVVGIVSAKLSTADALAATGALPENVNYAVKSSFLLSFLESVPDVANKLKDPNEKDMAFDDVVKSTQDAAVTVLVY